MCDLHNLGIVLFFGVEHSVVLLRKVVENIKLMNCCKTAPLLRFIELRYY